MPTDDVALICATVVALAWITGRLVRFFVKSGWRIVSPTNSQAGGGKKDAKAADVPAVTDTKPIGLVS